MGGKKDGVGDSGDALLEEAGGARVAGLGLVQGFVVALASLGVVARSSAGLET